MLIPVLCMTCGKTLADKWDWYEAEVKKLEEAAEKKTTDKPEEKKSGEFLDPVKTGAILDKLGLTRYCCRRHMLGHVEMLGVI